MPEKIPDRQVGCEKARELSRLRLAGEVHKNHGYEIARMAIPRAGNDDPPTVKFFRVSR